MTQNQLFQNPRRAGVLLALGALILAALFIGVGAWQAQAREADSKSVSEVPLAPSAGPQLCKIGNIAVYTSRIHVYCSNAPAGGIAFYATDATSTNEIHADRFLTMMNSAYALGKDLYIYYDSVAANNPPGCGATDCRNITGLYFGP